MSSGIDIIIPWVDGNDPKWLRERSITEKKYNINKQDMRAGIIFSIFLEVLRSLCHGLIRFFLLHAGRYRIF